MNREKLIFCVILALVLGCAALGAIVPELRTATGWILYGMLIAYLLGTLVLIAHQIYDYHNSTQHRRKNHAVSDSGNPGTLTAPGQDRPTEQTPRHRPMH